VIGVILAALSAASYGAADFSGAWASSDNESTLVTVLVQLVSLLSLIVLVVVLGHTTFKAGDMAWGALAGLGVALGLAVFYKALAIGPMPTAASLTALYSAGIPVATGLLLGDRPDLVTMVGIVLAVSASVLVSIGGLGALIAPSNTTPRERIAGLAGQNRTRVLSVIAGFGFGLFFVALSRTSGDSGLTPLLAARIASILALSVAITWTGAWAKVDGKWWVSITVAGLLDCAANALYLVALDHGSFIRIAAISSLHPAGTVLLARAILKKRLAPTQTFGLALAGTALAMVAVGA